MIILIREFQKDAQKLGRNSNSVNEFKFWLEAVFGIDPDDPEYVEKFREQHWGKDWATKDFYVNVYEIVREYGGPEEGGWWYDHGIPEGTSEEVKGLEAAYEVQERLEDEFPYSPTYTQDVSYAVSIEDHPPKEFPEKIPHYE